MIKGLEIILSLFLLISSITSLCNVKNCNTCFDGYSLLNLFFFDYFLAINAQFAILNIIDLMMMRNVILVHQDAKDAMIHSIVNIAIMDIITIMVNVLLVRQDAKVAWINSIAILATLDTI